jgi:acetylornithine deacetylase/succinyl-diaminopimelate desuccinylase-like protein
VTAVTGSDTDLRGTVAHLAALDRVSGSDGEHEAARWIAAALERLGARARIEEEHVHGGYFAPMGVPAAVSALAGVAVLRGRRAAGLVAAAAAALMAEDLQGGPRRPVRERLPQHPTWNVVGELGPADAPRTLVVSAHHDAARSSFIFEPVVPRLVFEKAPWLHDHLDRWPPLMGAVVAGPALVALGAALGRRGPVAAGTLVSAVSAALMAQMSRQPVVPGANDNLTGVAVLLEVARRFGGRPPDGLRVVLLSTGSEEANQDGMLAFARRHFGSFDPATTTFLCLDTVGSPELVLIEGEGFLRMRDYDATTKDLVEDAARAAGVHVRRGLRFTFGTDALIPLRQGFRVAGLGSVNEWLVPTNYHAATDTPENVDYRSVADAVEVVLGVAERLAGSRT